MNRVYHEYGRRSSSSRRLFLQAAEVIFKGTADLFRSGHFISLYRLTSGLLTVEKKQQERENERQGGRNKERDDKKKEPSASSRGKAPQILPQEFPSFTWNLEGRPLCAAVSRWLPDDFHSSSSSGPRASTEDDALMTVA